MSARLLSERVRKTPSTEVSEERYNFLKLSEAEPDLGVPSINGHVLSSTINGERIWTDVAGIIIPPGTDGQLIYNSNGSIGATAALIYDDINDRIGLGTATPTAKLDVIGDIRVNQSVIIDASDIEVSLTSPTEIFSFQKSKFRSGKILIQAFDTISNNTQISEILFAHNDDNVSATEYGVIFTGENMLANYSVSQTANSINLFVEQTTTNTIRYRIYQNMFLQ